MSNSNAPGGLSWAEFKAICAEVAEWTWGMVQGAFNEKASLSQILVDAVIGMIPLVGDVTAVRDLIAVVIGLVDDPKKRESAWEWVLLVVLICALIPVFGGVIKGVGRLVVKVAKAAEKLTGAARMKVLQEGARDIIEFLNRIGFKNAEAWFKSLSFAKYLKDVMFQFRRLMNGLIEVLVSVLNKMDWAIPASMEKRIHGLIKGLQELKKKGEEMIPKAIKELDAWLKEMQAYVHSGGETTSRTTAHTATTGAKNTSRADEARLKEEPSSMKKSTVKGGAPQNEAEKGKERRFAHLYQYEEGYPNLLKKTKAAGDGKSIHYPWVEAFSGKIVNREAQASDRGFFRVFGPGENTRGVDVDTTWAGGPWWGVGALPKNAEQWRMENAVLDEWNADHFIVEAIPPKTSTSRSGAPYQPVKGCFGKISEQSSTEIPGQDLPGHGQQAFMDFPRDVMDELSAKGEIAIKKEDVVTWYDPKTGFTFKISPTGWDNANGKHGYGEGAEIGAVTTVRLGKAETAPKTNKEVTIK